MTVAPSPRLLTTSHVQRTLWLDHRLAPGSAAYNLVLAIRVQSIDGPYEVERFARAVRQVVAAHELLGQRFVEVDGLPYRCGAESGPPELEVIDLSPDAIEVGNDTADEAVTEAIREFVDRPFDLRRGVARFGLVRLDPQTAVLVPVVHHAAGDYASHWILVRDLVAAYNGTFDVARARRAMPFDGAVDAEQRLLADPAAAESAVFWSARTADAVPTELPTDRPRPAQPERRGDCHRKRLPADVVARLTERAGQLGVTPFAVLLGAFVALVHRFSGADDVLVGCPASSRRGRRQLDTVGPFVNPVPVRAGFTAGTTLRATIAAAHEQLAAGLVHLRFPGGALAGGQPAYRLAVLLVDSRGFDLSLPAPAPGRRWGPVQRVDQLDLALMDVPSQGGQLDLVVRLEHSRAGAGSVLDGVFAYDTELFEPATIERFAAAFGVVLEHALGHPDTAVADVDLTDSSELHSLLALGGVWSA